MLYCRWAALGGCFLDNGNRTAYFDIQDTVHSYMKMNSYHVGVAAEAFVSYLFTRCGYDVSVQYGANQPEYDLVVSRNDALYKVSVKGSNDGGWGLCQSCLTKGKADYRDAIDRWLAKHSKKTVFALVQFRDVGINEMPRVYLATPVDIANRLKDTAKGRGDTTIYEKHIWTKRAAGAGTTEEIPAAWVFSEKRAGELFR
jgi:hypothetical protein